MGKLSNSLKARARRFAPILCTLSVVSLAFFISACGTDEAAQPAANKDKSLPIHNGVEGWSEGSVAVFAQGTRGQHICSGQLLTDRWVLTAEHCTVERDDNGNLLKTMNAWDMYATRDTNPGFPTAFPGMIGSALYRFGNSSDIAVLDLQQPLSLDRNTMPLLLPASREDLNGQWAAAWGYGDNQVGNTGAGTLRWGYMRYETLTDFWARNYSKYDVFLLSDPQEQQYVMKGDSGSPLLKYGPNNAWLIGVAGAIATAFTGNDVGLAVTPARFFDWLQDLAGGYVYIRSGLGRKNLDVFYDGTTPGTPVWAFDATGSRAQHWTYHPSTGQMKAGNGLCLHAAWGSNVTPTVEACHGVVEQVWNFTSEGELRSGLGFCLQAASADSGAQVTTESCNGSAEQHWGAALVP